ncbi:MAG: AMP-binding protein [Pseudomonadota bacterium]
MKGPRLTLYQIFARTLRRYARRPALHFDGTTLTYAELDTKATDLAACLSERGVGPGDRVALYVRNCLEFMIADQAIIKLGAAKVPLNELLAADDVGYMVEHSDARALIAHTSFAEKLATIAGPVGRLPIKLAVRNSDHELAGFEDFDTTVGAFSGVSVPAPAVKPDHPALMIYTGGTTGRPKGVLHTQESSALNLLAQVIGAEIMTDEHLLVSSPLPHSAQLVVQAGLLNGARSTIHQSFAPEAILKAIDEDKVTWTFMVPTMIYRMLDSPLIKDVDLSSLRTVLYGASPITKVRLQQAIETFGPVFLQLYGQTEAPNFITSLSKSDHLIEDFQTSCGQPVITCDVAICDEEGKELPYGEVGEITVRSPYTLECYYKDPEKTEANYFGDWMRTGDVAYQSETGHVYLVDRAKDMIISGGMNVYSTEVENVIQEFPQVRQVMVIGIPDDDWGEAVSAFIVPNETPFDEAGLMAHCKQRLAKYKVPKRIELIDEIPLTAYGKPDKKALRGQFWTAGDRQIN